MGNLLNNNLWYYNVSVCDYIKNCLALFLCRYFSSSGLALLPVRYVYFGGVGCGGYLVGMLPVYRPLLASL